MTEIIETEDMHLLKEDTPINKATLLDLDLDKQRKFIAKLQERRLKVNHQVVKARKAKDTCTSTNRLSQAVKFEKLGEKLEKLIQKIDTDISKAEKIADEIKVYRMTICDYDEDE